MEEKVVLKRQINLFDCFVLIVGTIIGSGIFISPKGVLENTGTVGWALVVWVGCGIFSTLGALCYAELGTTIQKSGGDYAYIMDSAGPVFAFLRVWTQILAIRTASSAVLAITAATYLISPIYQDCESGTPFAITRMLACTILIATTLCNCISTGLTRRVQIIFTIAKLLGLAIIIISGIVLLIQGNTSNFKNAFNVKEVDWPLLPLAFYSGLFAYSGWQYVTNVTEEMINPSRIIPISIITSMFFVTVVYVATNVAYFVVLTPDDLLASDAVAVSYGLRVLGNWWILMPIAVALSCIGSINGGIFTVSRQFYVAGRDGQFPEVLSMLHIDKKTPLPAAAVMLPIMSLMLTSDSVYSLINFLSFSRWAFIAMATASLPYFRWKFPDAERPFKVPLALPIIFVFLSIFMVAGSVYSAPRDVGIGILMTVAGIPVWLVFVWWESRPRWMRSAADAVTVFMQRTLYVVPSDEKEE
ncbi:putative cystine/glutamate transporter [Apostichopus japonicus]|uniref:Cystine/glutamate transporter n=1 Tax=Stichopus japonicus TaxID=307972 RepID=A0A2G8K6J6_STIJA|nr:putative cystine/glutamate transporter [Apostichopus japonicus]